MAANPLKVVFAGKGSLKFKVYAKSSFRDGEK
jgi:hypothetical protein